ncbi:ATP-dependent nuclease [Methanobrevibacter arboriphilus]|uniref:ATP-dependent nuclease n=1 Tax=Methanobrevibacter arboriphilus TaxID=39441 RepID=UPI000B2757C0|nr:AAA family ATPase [Methanobrevibacter arboriphilus]
MRPLSEEDIYQERTIEDYFNIGTIRENGKLTIFTGLESYDLLKSYAHGDFNERNLIEKYQAYLSENFFDGEEVYLIPKEKDKNIISIKIGNEFERPIYELGDGLQSIINITFPLFLNLKEIEETDNVLVFIEEPEIHLHPALQKKLIKTFEDDIFNNFQFFLTTHSNHFLDNTLTNNNVSVFFISEKK